jgi:NitT/TauT family transport system ATP-binding protein
MTMLTQPRPAHPTPTEAVVSLRGASKIFPNGTVALTPIDLTVGEGEFLTLLGPSGCGKSTLLRLVAGLLSPGAGQVECRARKIGFVFQEPTLMPWATVRDNVRLPLELAGQGSDAGQRVDAALAAVGLADFAGHHPRELSGGMRMRASIARALVDEPSLLLMDEPFGALDEITRNRLDADLLALCQARRLTVMFVTHSIHEAVFLSSRVLVMSPRPGRVVADLPMSEPYPRGNDFRTSARFAETSRDLMNALTQGAGGAL